MKYLTFYREDNNFNDILLDPEVKNFCKRKISWSKHLLLVFNEYQPKLDNTLAYLLLKYGDDVVNLVEKDYTPIMNIDYLPDRSNSSKSNNDDLI